MNGQGAGEDVSMEDRRYLQSGARHPNEPPFYCKITNQANGGGSSGTSSGASSGGANSAASSATGSSSAGVSQQRSYIVPGEFLPNRLTPGCISSLSLTIYQYISLWMKYHEHYDLLSVYHQ